jgi:hypothetical protein
MKKAFPAMSVTLAAIAVVALSSHLGGPSPAAAEEAKSAGEMHNEGVQFVLQHLKQVPSRQELRSTINGLASEWCATAHLQCSQVSVPPKLPLSTEAALAFVNGSPELKRDLGSVLDLFTSGGDTTSLQQLEQSLDQIEKASLEKLSPAERPILSEAISVATSSAKFWAPKAEGGLDGRSFLQPSGGRPVAFKIPWKKIAGSDLEGCISCFFGGGAHGCIACAVVFSVVAWLGGGD